VTTATHVPDALAEIGVGTVVSAVLFHVTVMVSEGVKPEPVMVVAYPEVGVSVMLGTVDVDAVTVKLPLADAICIPLEDAVTVIV